MDKRLAFNGVVNEYEKWRPDYVPEIFTKIMAYSEINKDNHLLEIGIGTGKATAPFIETNCRITAIELGDKLADFSRRKFAWYDNFEVIVADFETYIFPDDTYDLIYAACTFHWIPEEIGYPKAFNLLKSGGAFARFANWQQRDKGNEQLNEAIQKVYSKHMPNSAPKPDYTEVECKQRADIALKYGFTDIEYRMFSRNRIFDANDFISLQRTHGGHADMPEEQWLQFSDDIKEAINANGGKINIHDVMELQLARKP